MPVARISCVLATLVGAVAIAPSDAIAAGAPVITSLSRHDAPVSGRVALTIHGRGLSDVDRVVFGSSEAMTVHHLSATQLRVTVPFGRPGLVNVRVATPSSISARSVHTHFRFVPAPTVISASRNAGMTEGGQRIAVRGRDFRKVDAVRFGSARGRDVHVMSPSLLWVTTPAHRRGEVDIAVHTAFGSSAGPRFDFGPRPGVRSIGSTYGSTAGGTQLDISGASFVGYLSVLVDGKRMTWSNYGARDLTVRMPRHAAGLVHVQVANEYGTSRTTSADLFRYLPPGRQRWGGSQLVDPVRGFPLAVSCAPHLCAFVDPEGGLFTKRGDASWLMDVAPSTNGVQWRTVYCATDDFCVATGMDRGTVETHYDGAHWSAPTRLANVAYFAAVSCTSSIHCLAVAGNGVDLLWNGSSWTVTSDRNAPSSAVAMRCASPDACDAIDSGGRSYVFTDGAWKMQGVVAADGIISAACGSVMCMAVGPTATYVLDTTWTETPARPVGTGTVSCADSACAVVDTAGRSTTYSNGAWSTPNVVERSGAVTYLACRTATSCELVDEDGYAVTLTNGAAGPRSVTDPAQGNVTHIACAQSLCVLLDRYGSALTRVGTAAWSAPVKLSFSGAAVSCATSAWCVALAGGHGFVLGAGRWTDEGALPAAMERMSCPAVGYCIGVAGARVYRFDGTTWVALSSPGPQLSDVSCTAPGQCAVVGGRGGLYRLSGKTWASVPGAPQVPKYEYQSSVVCPSARTCFVLRTDGVVSRLDGAAWHVTSHVVDYAQTMACTSTTRCITVGFYGSSEFDGKQWTVPTRIDRKPFTDAYSGVATEVAPFQGRWRITSLGYVIEST